MSVRLDSNNLRYNSVAAGKQQQVNFQGLNRCFAKNFIRYEGINERFTKYTAEGVIAEKLVKYQKSNGCVGNLPAEWIAGIPKEQRKEHVQKVQNLFAGLAEQLYSPANKSGHPFNFAKFEGSMQNLLQLPVKVFSLSHGKIGKTYRLKIDDKNYVLKVFHSEIKEMYKQAHGKVLEPVRAPYVNKKGCGSFSKFYFGKLGTEKSTDSFMVTEYEQFCKKLPEKDELIRLIRILRSPLVSSDSDITQNNMSTKNMIGFRYIDLGGIVKLPETVHLKLKKLGDLVGRYYFKEKKETAPVIEQTLEQKFIKFLKGLHPQKNMYSLENVKNEISVLTKVLNRDCPTLDKYTKRNISNVLIRLNEILEGTIKEKP